MHLLDLPADIHYEIGKHFSWYSIKKIYLIEELLPLLQNMGRTAILRALEADYDYIACFMTRVFDDPIGRLVVDGEEVPILAMILQSCGFEPIQGLVDPYT